MASLNRQFKAQAIYPNANARFLPFPSRRSVVHSTRGIVACTQPLAAEAGQRILRMGGNAADAAVAVAAALNMTEPTSTGIGGDMFCLFFEAKTKKVHALNGSGRSTKATTVEQVRNQLNQSTGRIPSTSGLAVTIPGAAAGWVDTVEKFGSGKLSLEQILTPAIELGEDGFPVSELTSGFWQARETKLKLASPNFREMLKTDATADQSARAPRAGEVMYNRSLAKTFRTLAAEGKKGFYRGRIAQAIVDVLQITGGHMALSDLEDHMNREPDLPTPISIKFRGQGIKNQAARRLSNSADRSDFFIELWEHPPNGQGIVALMTLGILEELERSGQIPTYSLDDHNSASYLHALIEALRIAFTDAHWWITDPDHMAVTSTQLLSRQYLAERAKLFNLTRTGNYSQGDLGPSPAQNHSDTVYFAVTDKAGNGMSFINSNYEGFGSCIIPQGCGFTLQNRGSNFELAPDHHPNIYAGGKRPYHTIIPGLVTYGHGDEDEDADPGHTTRELHSVFGVMGGFMQPQGHVQVLLNMEVFGMNPQQALDAPRICIGGGWGQIAGQGSKNTVFLEEGIDPTVLDELAGMGHDVQVLTGFDRASFGRGQVVRRHVDEDGQPVFSGASDMRGDGCALPV